MKIQTIAANYLQTICWMNNTIIDWADGGVYSFDGKVKQLEYHYSFPFDSAICSADGTYVFIYQKLGTKGLLLKNGQKMREINRSYYYADTYEFPAAFVTLENKTYLVHCPVAYDQLDFEDVETGELITNIPERKPNDHFFSRLEISPDGVFLISKGWVWHPLDQIAAFNIAECIANPLLLDRPQFYPDVDSEVCTASFIDDRTVMIGSSDEVLDDDNPIQKLPPKHICRWDLITGQLSEPIKIKEDFGNLFAISADRAWDLFNFPKIIDINTGEITDQAREINSGKQQSSIIGSGTNYPSIIFNQQTKQIAINTKKEIIVLTPD